MTKFRFETTSATLHILAILRSKRSSRSLQKQTTQQRKTRRILAHTRKRQKLLHDILLRKNQKKTHWKPHISNRHRQRRTQPPDWRNIRKLRLSIRSITQKRKPAKWRKTPRTPKNKHTIHIHPNPEIPQRKSRTNHTKTRHNHHIRRSTQNTKRTLCRKHGKHPPDCR